MPATTHGISAGRKQQAYEMARRFRNQNNAQFANEHEQVTKQAKGKM